MCFVVKGWYIAIGCKGIYIVERISFSKRIYSEPWYEFIIIIFLSTVMNGT